MFEDGTLTCIDNMTLLGVNIHPFIPITNRTLS